MHSIVTASPLSATPPLHRGEQSPHPAYALSGRPRFSLTKRCKRVFMQVTALWILRLLQAAMQRIQAKGERNSEMV